ncbi:glutathione S-transferase family protein [Amphritea balenae]|uniref:Glutathione S-transferase family protein n=1 Tax=Amphritea balenae TaxID=452629 RepID=A0A3P1STS3_9GAMM|nr:glutathione S-transferase family protein [Amphritea balenae]RRC99955.1 glutathione S-transferase family protein [Amphritea balenae]GGK75385.1 glutathione-dependent reductase [Amphritea balenae]
MGLLIQGKWQDRWYETKNSKGEFIREQAGFRNWITTDGQQGESGSGGFKAEPDRYHLYVSLACPWAHRTLIFRKLMGLESLIGVSVVSPDMLEQGWSFDSDTGSTGDTLYGFEFMHQVYTRAQSDYTGRVTVPVLWDKQQQTIVSNESSEIIRMFNSAFNELTGNSCDLWPELLRDEIEEINSWIYDTINNGVYRAGFATTQDAYDTNVKTLFTSLDRIEEILSEHRYLAGSALTEADWRLFTTLIRFDAVYYGHFKCNLKQLRDYSNISGYIRELYQMPGIAGTVDMQHIKRHYYYSHDMINPTRIVPLGPELDFDSAHGRENL